MQDNVYTTLPQATTNSVTFDNLRLFVLNFVPRPDTQVFFDEYVKNRFTLSFASWTTDRRINSTGSEYQFDIELSVKINSLKFLLAAHQTSARSPFADKAINVCFPS